VFCYNLLYRSVTTQRRKRNLGLKLV